MDTDFIPFKLGMQYDYWEFDLESDFNTEEFERYLYVKNDINSLLGIPIERIYLSFNADILFIVEYEFKVKYYGALKNELLDLMPKGTLKVFGDRFEWKNEYCIVLVKTGNSKILLTFSSLIFFSN